MVINIQLVDQQGHMAKMAPIFQKNCTGMEEPALTYDFYVFIVSTTVLLIFVYSLLLYAFVIQN